MFLNTDYRFDSYKYPRVDEEDSETEGIFNEFYDGPVELLEKIMKVFELERNAINIETNDYNEVVFTFDGGFLAFRRFRREAVNERDFEI
jgi:hypothetical protein